MFLLLLIQFGRVVVTFESTSLAVPAVTRPVRTGCQSIIRRRVSTKAAKGNSGQNTCIDPCENPFDNDSELDRREALFALAGSLWAVGLLPDPAFAKAGTDANIQIPNPLQKITDRATKQCLVESLGNRECLVYMDEDNKLYEGTDRQLLLGRVEASAKALATIAAYIESKKWSQVTGVLTGPMGELVKTMGQLADVSPNAAACKKRISAFKTDLYALAAAVDKRDGSLALISHSAATASLVDFVKSL
jgi:hypothetical protein